VSATSQPPVSADEAVDPRVRPLAMCCSLSTEAVLRDAAVDALLTVGMDDEQQPPRAALEFHAGLLSVLGGVIACSRSAV